jgi:hypothetical protein
MESENTNFPTIHYIWLGSAITSCNYKENIAQTSRFEFVTKVVLWADNESEENQKWCSENNVELRYIGDRRKITKLLGEKLAPYYFNALDKLPPNYAVAADILRLQIIISETGLYLDVDVNIGTKDGDNITKESLEKILSSPKTLIGDGNDILFQPADKDDKFYRDVKKLMISRLQENSYSKTKENALISSLFDKVSFEKLEYTLQTTGPELYRDVVEKTHPEVTLFKRRCENSAKSWLGKKNKWKYWSLSRVKSITLSNIIADMRVQIGERRKLGPDGKIRLNFAKYEPVMRVLASNNSETTRNEILNQLITAILTEKLSKTVTVDDCVFYEDQDKRLFSTIKATTLSQQKIKHKDPQTEHQQSIDKKYQSASKIQRLFRKYRRKKQQVSMPYKKLYADSKQLNYRLWAEATYFKQKTPSTETVELLKKIANTTKEIRILTLLKVGRSNAFSTLKSYDAWQISFFTYFDLKEFKDNTEVLEAVFGTMENPNRSTIRRAMMYLLAHDRYEEIEILKKQFTKALSTKEKESIDLTFNETNYNLMPGERLDIKMRQGCRRHNIKDMNISITELVMARQKWQKEAANKIQRLFSTYRQKTELAKKKTMSVGLKK